VPHHTGTCIQYVSPWCNKRRGEEERRGGEEESVAVRRDNTWVFIIIIIIIYHPQHHEASISPLFSPHPPSLPPSCLSSPRPAHPRPIRAHLQASTRHPHRASVRGRHFLHQQQSCPPLPLPCGTSYTGPARIGRAVPGNSGFTTVTATATIASTPSLLPLSSTSIAHTSPPVSSSSCSFSS
jgi:hypothetical protein